MKRLLLAPLSALLIVFTPASAQASYADHTEALSFIADMADNHGFDRERLRAIFSRTEQDERVLRLIRPPETRAERSWQGYRARFLTNERISGGTSFWQRHAETIEAASKEFGVPAEFIVAIIGVETNYGSYTGNFETVSALATLAFDYPPRAELFRRELENLFLLAREQERDPLSYRGSYAGALGYPQFLPSSVRAYAVDFDGNGRIDFDSDPVDAIGSVANYFYKHGWIPGEPVAVRVTLPDALDPTPLIDAGIEPTLSKAAIVAQGIAPLYDPLHAADATLFDLPTPDVGTEYWLGYRNFYVITRYNRSSFYAMAVYELAQALKDRRGAAMQTMRSTPVDEKTPAPLQ